MNSQFRGTVAKKRFAPGSKSERDAIVLTTPEQEYLLRREGGNPFVDAELEGLVGKQVSFSGTVHGHTLVVSNWIED